MNIRLGIYEIFSRIVPGGLYIFAVGQLLVILGVIVLDWQLLNNLSLIMTITVVSVAYVLSEALDRFALTWFRVFCKKGYNSVALANFKLWYADKWDIDLKDAEWHVLIAYVRTKNLALADEIERHNAISIMLRNISFGLLLVAMNCFIGFFLHAGIYYLIAGIAAILFAVLVIQDAVKFHKWFFNTIFDTILAYRLDLEERIKPVQRIRKRTNAN